MPEPETINVVMTKPFATAMINLLNAVIRFFNGLPVAVKGDVKAHVDGLEILRDSISKALEG